MPTALETIRQHGDLLEHVMFADDEFAGRFAQYPIIWRALVLPNRDPEFPTLATQDWRAFAAHHYSAIVRCWNARTAALRIEAVCMALIENPKALGSYLDLQEHYVSFFGCMGGVKDNLGFVFDDPQVNSVPAFEQRCGAANTYGSIRWFYERRTQAVHKIVVPFFDVQGLPHFDMSAFADPDVQWDTLTNTDVRSVAEVASQLWDRFAYEAAGCWSLLLDILRRQHNAAFAEPIAEDRVIPLVEPQSSGSPQDFGNYIPPSGVKTSDDEQHGISGYNPKKDRK